MLPVLSTPVQVVIEIDRQDRNPVEPLSHCAWLIDPATPELADHLYLSYTLTEPAEVRLLCRASTRCGEFFLRAAKIQRVETGEPTDWSSTHFELGRWPLDGIRTINLGISGVCPASCVHCPTNKSWLDAPRGEVMSEPIFERLVEGLAACGLPVNEISLGPFGDPLTDRRLGERMLRLKAARPEVKLTIATTGAAYTPRQEAAIQAADGVAVHVESIDPTVYNRLMAPLRFEQVRPRIEALVRVAGHKATLAVPVHKGTRHNRWAGGGRGVVGIDRRRNGDQPNLQ
jgi:hypothetical protein